MNNGKKCSTCAWYCHADGKCYGAANVEELAVSVPADSVCRFWTFDGLDDQEREEYEKTLMTMEPEPCFI